MTRGPATRQYCEQLPGANLFDQAGERFQAGDHAGAAEIVRKAADAGNAEAQYALATMYKEGRGVPQDVAEAASLMGIASVAGNVDAMVEYAIAQFNGSGIAKNEAAAAKLFLIAARRGSAIAQDRLARW